MLERVEAGGCAVDGGLRWSFAGFCRRAEDVIKPAGHVVWGLVNLMLQNTECRIYKERSHLIFMLFAIVYVHFPMQQCFNLPPRRH